MSKNHADSSCFLLQLHHQQLGLPQMTFFGKNGNSVFCVHSQIFSGTLKVSHSTYFYTIFVPFYSMYIVIVYIVVFDVETAPGTAKLTIIE